MRLIDPILATSMAPVGVVLGASGVLALEFVLLGSWMAGVVMIAALIVLDIRSEARGNAPWTFILETFQVRSSRTKRVARNLFCGGFIIGVIACVFFAPDLYL